MKKLSINSKGSSVSEHDSTPSSPSSSTEDIPGAVQDNEQRSESPVSFSLSRVCTLLPAQFECGTTLDGKKLFATSVAKIQRLKIGLKNQSSLYIFMISFSNTVDTICIVFI